MVNNNDNHIKKEDDNNDIPSSSSSPSLPKLLSALALGARSVNSLPISSKNSNNNDDDDNDNDNENNYDDDEFQYQMAFPEFHTLCMKSRSNLAHLLSFALQSSSSSSSTMNEEENDNDPNNNLLLKEFDDYNFEDPILWENAAEACDILLEDVNIYIEQMQQDEKDGVVDSNLVKGAGNFARKKAEGGWNRMIKSLVDIEKSQITFHFKDIIENSRVVPWKPSFHPLLEKKKKIQPIEGHGLEYRNKGGKSTIGGSNKPVQFSKDVIAPSRHYPHPYHDEIKQLQYHDWQLELNELNDDNTEEGDFLKRKTHGHGGTLFNPSLLQSKGIWIDTEDDLKLFSARIENDNLNEIAVDLEAHSYRSFSGFTCLMQISLRRPTIVSETLPIYNKDDDESKSIELGYDFLIDTLALRFHMNKYLAPIFANPNIVKVLHGSNSDIGWLQRDFGIYVVNLFDTGLSCRLLPSIDYAGLAYLLKQYANVTADKKHQLSDWRQRPIPMEMRMYAVADTMYLLDIYDKLKIELHQTTSLPNQDISIKTVLDQSKEICLLRFDKEPFEPNGYKSIMGGGRFTPNKNKLSKQREGVLTVLYDWRDNIARTEDESIQYVCGNTALLKLASVCPTNVNALQALLNPLPTLVLHHANTILRLIRDTLALEKEEDNSNVDVAEERFSPSPHNKNRNNNSNVDDKEMSENGEDNDDDGTNNRNNLLSPVMNTEALYKQAGWTTPQFQYSSGVNDNDPQILSSTDDENEHVKEKKNKIEINVANTNFKATEYTNHSLEMHNHNDHVMDVCSSSRGGGADDNEKLRSRHAINMVDVRKQRGKTVDGLGAARVALNQDVEIPKNGTNDKKDDKDSDKKEKNIITVEDESILALENVKRIRGDLINGRGGGLGLNMKSHLFVDDEENLNVVDGRHGDNENIKDASSTTKSENVDEEWCIPKSMQEIYRISNKNRMQTKKKTLLPSSVTATGIDVDKYDVDEIEGANRLLSTSGEDSKDYFDSSTNDQKVNRSKRQWTKIQGNNDGSSGSVEEVKKKASKPTCGKDDDIALMVELGWIKDKEEAESLMVQSQIASTDNETKVCNKESEVTSREGKVTIPSKPVSTTLPYDYSTTSSGISAYDPNRQISNNPFFTGAAISGGILSNGNGPTPATHGKKKKNAKIVKEKRTNTSDRPPKRGDGKTFIYHMQK